MQEKINILTELIQKSGLKPTQKNLAFKILSDIVVKYNISENKYYNRVKQDQKIKKDFTDYFDRVYLLLKLMGISELDIFELNYKFFDWIFRAVKNNETTENLSYNAIKQLEYYLLIFQECYNKLPDNMEELKKFILEPLEITEDTLDAEYNKALKHLNKTKEILPILKIGFFKELQGKIIKK